MKRNVVRLGEQAIYAEAGELASARYGLDLDLQSVPRLCAEHGLAFPMIG